MPLPDASIDILKKICSTIDELSPVLREHEHEQARHVLSGLRTSLADLADDQLAAVSYVLANITSSLSELTVHDLAETLMNSTAAYSLAAAHLVKLHDIAAPKPPAEANAAAYVPGGYL